MSDNLDGLLSSYLRRKRLEVARPFIRGRVLDYGCGIGLAAELTGRPEDYVGLDGVPEVLAEAKRRHPSARFLTPAELSAPDVAPFDTILALAVIEHLPAPQSFLERLASHLKPDGRIVVTTPNPALDWAHGLGGHLGLFARESHLEHQSLMGRRQLFDAADKARLDIDVYRRFLFGANQLAVMRLRVAT